MKNKGILLLLILINYSAKAQDMVVSSYYLGSDFRDSWIELLVTNDNIDIRNWRIGDFTPNGGGHLKTYQSVQFGNITFWANLRRGSIILLYCRAFNSKNLLNPLDFDLSDGYLSINAQIPIFFNNIPAINDTKLNLDTTAEMVSIQLTNGTNIHSLGHGSNNSNWNILNNPKLYNDGAGLGKNLIQVCPGSNIAGFDNIQEDTIKTNMTSISLSQGLPNVRSGNLDSNLNYWLSLREPKWTSPNLTISSNANRTIDTLRWNLASNPFPSDNTQGYLIIKSTSGNFPAHPADGTVYTVGNLIGGNPIIAIITSSQTSSFIYNHSMDCNRTYYRVYAYRYTSDQLNGNSYHLARGRAYNQSNFATGNSPIINPIPILYHY